ncbi:hypothetical protein Plhal304r1_c051g0134111 [Plasmopara halstedii]
MFFFNTHIIAKAGGSYGDNADLNVAELKAIMKNLVISDRPQKTQPTVWASDLDKRALRAPDGVFDPRQTVKKVNATTQTDGRYHSFAGGKTQSWAYQPKKKNTVKTFAI